MTGLTPTLNVDLHCHSAISDGVLPPSELAVRAHANGVQVWALTDHDTLDGLPEAAKTARELGLCFINGVEISVTWAAQIVHIVGLGVDAQHCDLQKGLHRIRAHRVERAHQMSAQLARIGIPGAYEGALAFASNPALISRTHFARYLVQAGFCANLSSVFTRFLGEGCPGYVPTQWATLDEAIGWIRAAGGQAVMAHPGRYKYTAVQFSALCDAFIALGGTGIEVITGSHSPKDYVHYAHVARERNLLASCGSDFHSPTESRIDLGRLPPLPADLRPIWHLIWRSPVPTELGSMGP